MPAIAPDQNTQISSLIFNWLSFFKTHYQALLDEYALLQSRHLEVASALSLARHYSADDKATGLNSEDVLALDALLSQLTPETLLQPQTVEPFAPVQWRLPNPNPFLRVAPIPASPAPATPAMVFDNHLATAGEASVYLRWTLLTAQPTLYRLLNESLTTLIADAGQAGVTLAFSAYGNHWQLKLSGLTDPLPAVLEHALHLLAKPTPQTLARYGQTDNEPVPIPIRQLLKTLPDHFFNSPIASEVRDPQTVWGTATWNGFAAGIEGVRRVAIVHALHGIPGVADPNPPQATAQRPEIRWAVESSESSENALLMFYPTPTTNIDDEATWRLFAHVVQGPFYQRLRVELQLGYAVFSGFRQIAGQCGLLFGVQSPSANAGQLVEHIGEVLNMLPALIESADLQSTIKALQQQLTLTSQEFQSAAEALWQSHLAGHAADYAENLQHSLAHLPRDKLHAAASRVALPETPVLYLSNRAAPDGLRLAHP